MLLHLSIQDRYGLAKAIFHREPSQAHYELLRVVGVEYLGGQMGEDGFISMFRNRLPAHLHAGALANYERTGNCNRFFFNHGEIDPTVEAGLIRALESRIEWAQSAGLHAAEELAFEACNKQLAMSCHPPSPELPFNYGDLVPLGFLLRALNQSSRQAGKDAAGLLREKLLASRQSRLWSFHTGRLITSTDSVLVLQALADTEGVECLELFADGFGGYYPQLWSLQREPGRMRMDYSNAHWCQADFATTCLVRGLRAEANLPTLTSSQYLEDHFETRSGLYFANPYLTDFALATALREDSAASPLKRRLTSEILASMNEDYSFGNYDRALSTSLAILSLAALGCRGRLVCLSQLRLLEMMEPAGTWPECTPFYSTFLVNASLQANLGEGLETRKGSSDHLDVDGSRYELSLYVDKHRIISTSIAILALSEPCDPRQREIDGCKAGSAHQRYKSSSHADYISNFALQPYVTTSSAQ